MLKTKKWLALLEVGFFTFFLLFFIWWLIPHGYKHWSIPSSMLLLIISSHFWHGENLYQIGLDYRNFLSSFGVASLIIFFIIVGCTCIIILSGKYILFGGQSTGVWLKYFAGYILWASFQQYLLFYIVNRLAIFLGRESRWVTIVSAAIFSVVHYPNMILMYACLLGGLVIVELFLKYRSLYFLAVGQALIGGTIHILGYSMKVGPGYWK